MGIGTQIRAWAPKLSKAFSTGRQELKSLHPLKKIKNSWARTVQQFRKAKVKSRMLKDYLSERLPGKPLKLRNVVASDVINVIVGDAFDAQSHQGVVLSDGDVEALRDVDSYIQYARNSKTGSDGSDSEVRLVGVKKKALKARKSRVMAASKSFHKAQDKLRIAQSKSVESSDLESYNETIEKLKSDTELKRDQYQTERKAFTTARRIFNRLKMLEIGEKYSSRNAAEVIDRITLMAGSFDENLGGTATDLIYENRSRGSHELRDIEFELSGMAGKLSAMVYKDVVDFLDDANGDHQKLVESQKKRQLTKGTEKLSFATEKNSIKGRLPGLDFYMMVVNNSGEELLPPTDKILKACKLMKKDWELFQPAIRAEKAIIRVDPILDNQGNTISDGQFDAGRMWDLHHIDSYEATVKWLDDMIEDSSRRKINDVLASYGEDFGFGVDANPDDYSKAMTAKYGTNFKTIFESGLFSPTVEAQTEPSETIEATDTKPPLISVKDSWTRDSDLESVLSAAQLQKNAAAGSSASRNSAPSTNPFSKDFQPLPPPSVSDVDASSTDGRLPSSKDTSNPTALWVENNNFQEPENTEDGPGYDSDSAPRNTASPKDIPAPPSSGDSDTRD